MAEAVLAGNAHIPQDNLRLPFAVHELESPNLKPRRIRGHQEGAKTVRRIVTECARLRKERGGPDFLTLYSFSLENWKRPATEVTFVKPSRRHTSMNASNSRGCRCNRSRS